MCLCVSWQLWVFPINSARSDGMQLDLGFQRPAFLPFQSQIARFVLRSNCVFQRRPEEVWKSNCPTEDEKKARRESEEKDKGKEMQVRESREQLFFPMVCGSKSRLFKAAAIQFVATWHPVLLQPAPRRDWHANNWQYNFWQCGSQI